MKPDADAAPQGYSKRKPVRLDLDAPWGRLRARLMLWFNDHGVMRAAFFNLRRISDEALRSAQPGPQQVRRLARRGVKTIVNLRGGRDAGALGAYLLEREACQQTGVALEELKLRSRQAPAVETLEAAAEMLERISYPVLFHCKSGADRAGLMSALYVLLRGSGRIEDAKAQLSLRYGHIRYGKTGVLDAFLELYEADAAAEAAAGRRLDFMTWARTRYDQAALQTAFRSKRWGDLVVDRLLRRE